MTERKYAKNIVTGPRLRPMPGIGPNLVTVPATASDLSLMQVVPPAISASILAGSASRMTRLLWMDDEVVKGSSYMDFVWYHQPSESGPGPHIHDFDETLGFIGTDPQNPRDLGGVMELWIDDEKYLLEQTCLVFVPRGVKHCPMICRRADRPFVHFTAGNQSMYQKSPELT